MVFSLANLQPQICNMLFFCLTKVLGVRMNPNYFFSDSGKFPTKIVLKTVKNSLCISGRIRPFLEKLELETLLHSTLKFPFLSLLTRYSGPTENIETSQHLHFCFRISKSHNQKCKTQSGSSFEVNFTFGIFVFFSNGEQPLQQFLQSATQSVSLSVCWSFTHPCHTSIRHLESVSS